MALTSLADVSGYSTDGSSVTTGAMDTTGADLLIAVVSSQSSSPGTITDSKGNTWHALTSQVNYYALCIYWCVPTSVGSGHTFSASGSYPSMWVGAYSGADPSPFDAESGAGLASGTTGQPGGITPSVDGCLLVTAVEHHSDNSTPTVDSGFSVVDSVGVFGVNVNLAVAELIQATAAAVNPTWNWDTWAGGPVAVMAAFKPLSAPALVAGSASFEYSGPAAVSGSPGIAVVAEAPTGGSGSGPTYQWERSVDGGSYADATGETALEFVDTDVSEDHIYSYRCKQTRGVDTVATAAVVAQVYPGGTLSGGSRRMPFLTRGR